MRNDLNTVFLLEIHSFKKREENGCDKSGGAGL